MARAIDPREPFPYVLEEDRALPEDSPERTVWMLRALTSRESAMVEDGVAETREEEGGGELVRFRQGSTRQAILRLGLQGWKNFIGGDGTPVEFRGRKVGTTSGPRIEATDEDIDRIDTAHRTELANAITRAGRMSKAEAGKS